MKFLQEPFFLGDLELPNNIFYAPLAGCSDLPFRQMSRMYHPSLIFCEMVKMDALIRNDINTLHILDYEASMHPIGGQIVGSNPAIAGQAAKIIEDLGFDTVDLNCGCPVDKVTKDGSGSAMLKTPLRIGDVLAEMVASVKIPVTLKIRSGWDDFLINAPEITRIAEDAGAKAITIHGRTRMQAYRGKANWDWIKECKERSRTIKVIGNGDIFDSDCAGNIFEQTFCDAILVSRGTMGQPWIAEDICRKLKGEVLPVRSLKESRDALLKHFSHSLSYYSEKKALIDIRKLACWYFKKDKNARNFRQEIAKVSSKKDAYAIIEKFWGDL